MATDALTDATATVLEESKVHTGWGQETGWEQALLEPWCLRRGRSGCTLPPAWMWGGPSKWEVG